MTLPANEEGIPVYFINFNSSGRFPFLKKERGGLRVYPERSRRAAIFSKKKDFRGIYTIEGIPKAVLTTQLTLNTFIDNSLKMFN